MPCRNSRLHPHRLLHSQLFLGAGALSVSWCVWQVSLWAQRAVAWHPKSWRSTWAQHSTYRERSRVGSWQADTVCSAVWHHAAVVTAASTATAGHSGFLLEVLREATSYPCFLYFCLHLRTEEEEEKRKADFKTDKEKWMNLILLVKNKQDGFFIYLPVAETVDKCHKEALKDTFDYSNWFLKEVRFAYIYSP